MLLPPRPVSPETNASHANESLEISEENQLPMFGNRKEETDHVRMRLECTFEGNMRVLPTHETDEIIILPIKKIKTWYQNHKEHNLALFTLVSMPHP